jgi:PLD-like domain
MSGLRRNLIAFSLLIAALAAPRPASSAEQAYFSATDNVTNVLVQRINAETVRLDISSWYLSEHSISIAIANRFAAGVPVRLMGDRGAIFEADPHTKTEFYWLASQGIPIRLRFNPTYFPEINHWKMALFVGQNVVEFGSGNFAPTELAPVSATNYDDETALFSDDPAIVNAFKTKFDVMWNDTTLEPESIIGGPPYFKSWDDACASEPTGNCADCHTLYPNPVPMIVNTARLEGDNPTPPDLIWGQGPDFNNRLTQEINNEPNSVNSRVDLVVYRLEVDNITNALIAKYQAGVPVRILVDPGQYTNILYPEYWLTHASIDKLWAAGVPIRQTMHQGVTHMKTLVTSSYATNASSNFGPNWQRDHDYFVPRATKPVIYQAIADRVSAMWNDTTGFGPLQLTPPRAADLTTPPSNATGIATNTSFVWNLAAWAVSYDVYLGTSQANMVLVANVPAQLVVNPPNTYSWTPPAPLQGGTTYFWKVVSRTNATPLAPTMIATSAIWAFTTSGTVGPPAAPTSPTPSNGSTGVSTTPLLGWSAGAAGTTFNVAFGTSNPPSQVASALTTPSFSPGTLTANTTYFWKVTAASAGGSTAGALWSFTTGTGGGGASEVVIYASDVTPANIHGTWSQVADATAAAGIKLTNPDAGAAVVDPAFPAPTNYFDASFQAAGGTRYRVWLRLRAIGNSKFNDSVFVQFSDSTDSGGNAIYRTGTTGALLVNLATDSTGSSLQGWGWQRNAYWLSDTGDVWFQNSGSHTIRVQVREDGAEIDQIVISPLIYATNPPGPVSNDNTIVAKPSQCQDTMTLSYTSGTLNMGFTVGTSVAANWKTWMFAQNTLTPLWSVALPVISPAVSFNIPVPGFPHLGTVYLITTLGPGTQATCYDVKSIDTQ